MYGSSRSHGGDRYDFPRERGNGKLLIGFDTVDGRPSRIESRESIVACHVRHRVNFDALWSGESEGSRRGEALGASHAVRPTSKTSMSDYQAD